MSLSGAIKKVAGSFSGSDFLNGLGTVSSMIAPAVGSYLSFQQQQSLINQQQQFQEHMSNTAHQREVSDLLAAGINPLYTATGGQGASTPMGATGTQTDFANAFSSGIGRAFQKQMQRAQIENYVQQNNNLKANFSKTDREAQLMQLQIDAFPAELASRIKLQAAQTEAALQAGAASSAQASYQQQMSLMAGLDRMERQQLWEFLKQNPMLMKVYMSGYGASGMLGNFSKR